MNGDEYDDVIVGALRITSSFRGAAYIVFGRGTKSESPVQLANQNTNEFIVILKGGQFSWFGYSVSGAGGVLFVF